jgi:hypothetical protein
MSYRKERNAWKNMISRCENKKDKRYNIYGDRGIKVCKRWHKFENFISDIGEAPKGGKREYSLDRIDNNKGYFKKNCRWATAKEQANNRRKNIECSLNGAKVSLHDITDFFGVNYKVFHQRLHRDKLPLKRALSL